MKLFDFADRENGKRLIVAHFNAALPGEGVPHPALAFQVGASGRQRVLMRHAEVEKLADALDEWLAEHELLTEGEGEEQTGGVPSGEDEVSDVTGD